MGLIVQMTAKWQHLMTGSVKQLLLVLCPPAPSLHQHQPPSPQPRLHLHPPQYFLHLGVFKTVHGMSQAAGLVAHLMERACHGISCDVKGKIVAWDDWNCEDTDENPKPTTKADKGCYYKKMWHPQGSISEGSDSNGCRYGVICGDDGQVQCDGMNLTVIPSRRIESHKLLPLTISLAI